MSCSSAVASESGPSNPSTLLSSEMGDESKNLPGLMNSSMRSILPLGAVKQEWLSWHKSIVKSIGALLDTWWGELVIETSCWTWTRHF